MTSNPQTLDWHRCLAAFSLIAGCALYSTTLLGASPSARSAPTQGFQVEKLPLPAAQGLVVLDSFAYDPVHKRVWVPAGNLGGVAVIDAPTDRITMVNGFRTGEVELLGRKRVLGPSSVSIGEGVVYIGNRGDSNICVVDAASLALLDCQPVGDPAAGLAAAPDAVV